MKIFKNKFLVKLIASICLILVLMNFTGITKVYAAKDDDQVWGSTLLKPITNLMVGLADGLLSILHKATVEQPEIFFKISGQTSWQTFWKTVLTIVVIVVAIVVVAVATYFTGGLAAAIVGKVAWLASASTAIISGAMLATAGVGATISVCVVTSMTGELFADDIYLPIFSVSPEEIFSNQIYLFDVDFFGITDKTYKIHKSENETVTLTKGKHNLVTLNDISNNPNDDNQGWMEGVVRGGAYGQLFADGVQNTTVKNGAELDEQNMDDVKKVLRNITIAAFHKLPLNPIGDSNWFISITDYNKIDNTHTGFDEDYNQVTTGTKTETANINFTREQQDKLVVLHYKAVTDMSTGDRDEIIDLEIPNDAIVPTGNVLNEFTTVQGTAQELNGVVSSWYFILRNLALLVLMLVLIYTGIRIVIGSTAGEKAKYKERLMDWLVATCLIFIMHYIMVFAVGLVNEITDLVKESASLKINGAYIPLTDTQRDNIKNMGWDENSGNTFSYNGLNMYEDITPKDGFPDFVQPDPSSDSGYSIWWQSNIMGLFRLHAQLEKEGSANWIGYSFCYVVLVIFIIIFAVAYLKRVIYMAFLTMIAPLVAMTYPIDKMTDGKAQAFDAWLKEYIFNLLIQPLHLLLYSVLVTSAFELVTKNAVYALVAIGFMTPAERLLRRFFGFEKAKTPGLLGGAAGAALAMTGLQSLLKPRHKGGNHDGGGNGKGKGEEQGKVKFANKNNVDTMAAIANEKKDEINLTNNKPKANDEDAQKSKGTAGQENSSSSWERSSLQSELDTLEAAGYGPGDPEYDDLMNRIEKSNYTQNEESSVDLAENQDAENSGIENLPENTKPEVPNVPTAQNNQKNQKEEKKKRHIWRAVGAATAGVGKNMVVGALRGFHPVRLAGKIAAGAAAGTAGLLIGVASGDGTKALQYATTGAVAGSTLANSLSGRGQNLIPNDLHEQTKKAYYGEEYSEIYKQKIMEEQKKQLESSQNVNYIRQMMSVDNQEAKRILETTGGQCFDNGITDVEDIATIHQLTHGEDAMSFEKAVAARSYAKKRLGGADIDQMTQDKVQKYKDRWADEFKEKYKNLNDKQAQMLADQAFKAAIRFNKAKSSLTKF